MCNCSRGDKDLSLSNYLSLETAKLLSNAFINSQSIYLFISFLHLFIYLFIYLFIHLFIYLLVWMFCRKQQYLKIRKIHRKALKVVMTVKETTMSFFWITMKFTFIKDACFNMWSFKIFKQSKSWVYLIALCFKKDNMQYTK